MLTLHQLFEKQAERAPDTVAIIFGAQRLTYGELNSRANQLAHSLRRRGVGPDSLVGLYFDRSIELVVGILGILKAGGAYLPIDRAYPKDRIAFMLADAKVAVLLTHRELVLELPAGDAEIICLADAPAAAPDGEPSPNPAHTASPENLAYVIFTSGSTGQPKGALITHANVVRLFDRTAHWFQFGPADVWTLFHSSAFDFSVWEIWGALLYGGKLIVVPYIVSRSPEAFHELLVREQVTVLNQTPSAFRQLIRADESAADPKSLALRYVIFGGEALEMQSLKPWFDRHGDKHPQLVNMYGITETTVHVTYRPLTKNDVKSGSVIGEPIPDLQVHILDSELKPVATGVTGEMFVGGAGLARGYLNRPELTRERFIPNPFSNGPNARLYRTGDLARFLPDGDLEYLGRIDDQVKIRGFRIELGEIESALCRHPAVREAVVLPRDEGNGEKRLIGYLVFRAGPRPTSKELREHLKTGLPDYMVPANFVPLDRVPLTNNGKVDRQALRALPIAEAPAAAPADIISANALEREIHRIWSETLKGASVGFEDNFFDLGGDSLLLAQVHERLEKLIGRNFPITNLFAHTTIRALAAHLGYTAPKVGGVAAAQERARRQREALAARPNVRR